MAATPVKKVASEEVAQLQGLLHDQPHNPMRPNVLEYHREEITRLNELIAAPAYVQANRGHANQKRKQIQQMLDSQAPKEIAEPMRKDAVAKLAQQVLDNVIKPAMLTHEEMRRNPVGAVDGFLRRENSAPIKDAILTWKRAMRALDPENQDVDYTNMERFRANTRTEGAATFMAQAQIPGNFAMTPQAKANWPLGEATGDTVMKQLRRQELAQRAVKARWAKRDAKLAKQAVKAAKLPKSSITPPTEG